MEPITSTTIKIAQYQELMRQFSHQFLPTIEGIATGTPPNIVRQSDAAKFVANHDSLGKNRHRIEKIYKNTRIDQRNLAVDILSDDVASALNINKRMKMYEEHAIPLAEQVAKKALQSAAINTKAAKIEDQIGMIIFVTSTGFVAPGIDTHLIKILGLKRNIARVPVNFMGCAAAMNGLRVGCNFVRANPTQKALVVCLELSSINAVFEDNINDVIIHSIFGDGCAAVVLGAWEESTLLGQNKIVIKDNFSHLVEDTEDGINLGVRDNGITCKLSRHLPDYIEAGVGPIINNFLASHQLTKDNIDLWAVHPGGTRIIQKVQLSLGLSDEQVADSWEILRNHGNMLSCAVLFVIERIMLRLEEENARKDLTETIDKLTGISFSFSPGVGIEGILFEKY